MTDQIKNKVIPYTGKPKKAKQPGKVKPTTTITETIVNDDLLETLKSRNTELETAVKTMSAQIARYSTNIAIFNETLNSINTELGYYLDGGTLRFIITSPLTFTKFQTIHRKLCYAHNYLGLHRIFATPEPERK